MTSDLATRIVPARIGRIRYRRPMCAGCANFQRRDPALPWPIAGVPTMAHGRCAGGNRDKPWRCETDWCEQFEGKGETMPQEPPS